MKTSVIKTLETEKKSILRSIGIQNIEELSKMEPITDLSAVKELLKINSTIEIGFQEKIYDIIQSSKALIDGHFVLLSGKHSKYFIRFSKISRSIKNLKLIAELICKPIIDSNIEFDIILSPETAGSSLASAIAELLTEKYNKKNIITIYAKTDEFKKPTSLINWIDLPSNSNVLLVNDIISTGAGIRELANLAQKQKGNVVGVCAFTFRGDLKTLNRLKEDYPNLFFYLVDSSKFNNYTYEADENEVCVICENSKTKPIHSRYLN